MVSVGIPSFVPSEGEQTLGEPLSAELSDFDELDEEFDEEDFDDDFDDDFEEELEDEYEIEADDSMLGPEFQTTGVGTDDGDDSEFEGEESEEESSEADEE